MIDANQCRQQLASLLQQQIEETIKTNGFLVNIKDAIAENRLDAVSQQIDPPQVSFEKTEQLERQRQELMQTYGYATDREGLEHCIRWCDDQKGTLQALHGQLLDALAALERSLQISNLLVNKGKQRLQRALDVLTWQPASTNTYNASGTTESSNTGKRNIATA